MDNDETRGADTPQLANVTLAPSHVRPTTSVPARTVAPQTDTETCAACGSETGSKSNDRTTYPFVYAIGKVRMRFPNIGVEKEFAQVASRSETAGYTDRRVQYEVIRQHRYLARKVCYVLAIGDVETYILQPRDSADFELLIEAVGPDDDRDRLDAVIGVRGRIAPMEMCNGLMVPLVAFDQLYSFDRESLRRSIPHRENIPEERFLETASYVLDRMTQFPDNAGATDEDRALNYLALRYNRIYEHTADAFGRDQSFSGIEVRNAPLTATRKLVDVILAYTNRNNDVVEKYSVRVDVTDEFPFLVKGLLPYLDR